MKKNTKYIIVLFETIKKRLIYFQPF